MNPQDIQNELKALSAQMVKLGTAMEYFGGMNDLMVKRGKEMASAGLVAEAWAEHIEHELWEQSEGAKND